VTVSEPGAGAATATPPKEMAPDFSGAISVSSGAGVLVADLLALEDHSAIGCDHPLQDEVTPAYRRIGALGPLRVIRRGVREGRGGRDEHRYRCRGDKEFLHELLLSRCRPY
jgi:hypothetical protein